VRSLIRPRLLLDWPVSQSDAAQRSHRFGESDRHDLFDDYELHHLAGVGHFVPLEAPQAIAEATVRALPR
jgi:pimeloyl-ACP methyl ester carboxylesterase